MEKPTDEGGYIVPEAIGVWLYRWQLLQLLADRANLNRVYFFTNLGLCVIEQ